MSDPIIYTNATITASAKVPDVVHIHSSDPVNNILLILTQDEFTDELKRWLRSMPSEEQRQMVLDELVACTLRTVE